MSDTPTGTPAPPPAPSPSQPPFSEGLAKVLAAVSWPLVALLFLVVLRAPLIQILEAVSNQFSQVVSVSIEGRNVKFDLSHLPKPPNKETLDFIIKLSGSEVDYLLKHRCGKEHPGWVAARIEEEDKGQNCFRLTPDRGEDAREYLFKVIEAEV